MLKVGLIGCGGIGAVHAECWLTLSDKVRIVAVADTSPQKAQKYADQVGAKIYSDGMELLKNEDLDIVDICLPTFLHAKFVLQAMEYVKNIMVEKPICLKESDVQLLLEAQEKTSARVMVGQVARFTPPYIFLKELVDSAKYGSLVTGQFSHISPRPVWMRGHDDINVTGGVGLDLHIHDADYIRYLMNGEPDNVDSWGIHDKNDILQHLWSSYRYGNALLTSEASWDYPTTYPFQETFRVKLEHAALLLDEKGVLTVYPTDGDAYIPELEGPVVMDMGINVSDMGPFLKEINYFLNTIIQDAPVEIASLSEAAASFKLVKKELELVKI